MTIIVNGAPHYVDLGTKDSSGRQILRLAVSYPQHLPKWYIFAKKGSEADWLGAGAERLNQYGDETFAPRSKYFSHQTQGANISNEQGNMGIYHRVVPNDAGPASNLTLWLDLLSTQVDDYARNGDGSIRTVDGQPVILGQIPGFKYQWSVTNEDTLTGVADIALKTQTQGSMFDPANPTIRSTKYPIASWAASSRGAWGNDVGISLWSLDSRVDAMPEKLVKSERVVPMGFRMVERDQKVGSVTTLKTALNGESIVFTLKPGAVDPSIGNDTHIAAKYNDNYFQSDTRYPLQEPALSSMVVHQNNIDAVLEALYQAELPYVDPNYHDFRMDGVDEKYLFNFLGGRTLNGYLYHSFVPVVGTLSMDRNQVIYAAGGSDGTLTGENLENGMIADVRRYRDANDKYQDKAYNIESHMYDTGWSIDGKFEMASYISLRGDTFATFGTFEDGGRVYDNAEELSSASGLKARLANLPESTYFGTSVVRAGIYAGSAKIRNSQLNKRVSTVMEIIHKRSKYLGAANGAWKSGAAYDQGAPGSVAEILYDFSNLWVPVSVRYRFWDAGLNWWGNLDREQAFCPAFRTVYSDDTSVLTADTVAMALIFANRVNDRSWRVHSGTTGVPGPVFIERIKNFINSQVEGKIDGRYGIEPVPSITANDELRGYSWHSGINIFADPMRTVAVNYAEVFRASDRGAASPNGSVNL